MKRKPRRWSMLGGAGAATDAGHDGGAFGGGEDVGHGRRWSFGGRIFGGDYAREGSRRKPLRAVFR